MQTSTHTSQRRSALGVLVLLASLAARAESASAVNGGQISTYGGGGLGGGQASGIAQQPVAVAFGGGVLYVADSANSLLRAVDTTTGNEAVLAGTGTFGNSGDGGPAVAATLDIGDVTLAADGSPLIAGSSSIRRVDASSGIISTIAGGSDAGFAGDGGPAVNAALSYPSAPVADAAGNLYFADTGNSRIRKITTGGIISTIAGNGDSGFSGDNGPASAAVLNGPRRVVIDGTGKLLFSDQGNNRIRSINLATGVISTIAGNGTAGFGGDGGPPGSAQLNGPVGISVDGSGNLLIADTSNNRIRFVNRGGTTVTEAGVVVPANQIQTIAGNGLAFYSGDNGPATSASLNIPAGVLAAANNVFIADTGNNRARVVNPTGTIATSAGNGDVAAGGDGGPAAQAQMGTTYGLTVDGQGNVYYGEFDSRRIRMIAASTTVISTVAGTGVPGDSGDGGPATQARFQLVNDLGIDSARDLFLSDTDSNRIRKVDASTKTITTVAGTGSSTSSGDGGPATHAGIRAPSGIGVDPSGNLYISEQTTVRRVSASTGIITRFAGDGTVCDPTDPSTCHQGDGGPANLAQIENASDIKADGAGNVYIIDGGRIRKVSPSGTITTVAGNGLGGHAGDGGPATSAAVSPRFIALDGSGNLFIDDEAGWISKVDAATGLISTVAGNGVAGFSGDGGPAVAAMLNSPDGVGLDPSGNLFIADGYNRRIREVAAPLPVQPARFVATDFDGDFRSDISVYRPTAGVWYSHPAAGGPDTAVNWGSAGDIPVPADYDGDHRTDQAIFRPSTGLWAEHKSSGGDTFVTYGGISGDVPVAADYDGDGKADIAIYRPSSGTWYVHRSSNNVDVAFTYGGITGDLPVPADYDGDHKVDFAIFRRPTGEWFIRRSSDGADVAVAYGSTGDIPVPADDDGDLKADIGIFRPSTGLWAIHRSSDGADTGVTYGGVNGDVPVVADYDRDGLADIAIFRPAFGAWFVHRSTDAADAVTTFGIGSDIPLALPYPMRSAFFGGP